MVHGLLLRSTTRRRERNRAPVWGKRERRERERERERKRKRERERERER
jgi:hypothetical protein